MCDPVPADPVVAQSLFLFSVLGQQSLAVGTAFVIGQCKSESDSTTTLVAVTAKHCLTNIYKHFNGSTDNLHENRWWRQESNKGHFWLSAGDTNEGFWQCIWLSSYIDDLALVFLKSANPQAANKKFHQPLITFELPRIGSEVWGFGFADSRSSPENYKELEMQPKLTKGNVIQHLEGSLYGERIVAAIPTRSGMSGGPVFWAKCLLGVISSTFGNSDDVGTTTLVTRVRHIWNIPLDGAPAFNGQRFTTGGQLGEAGFLNFISPSMANQDEPYFSTVHKLPVWVRKEL